MTLKYLQVKNNFVVSAILILVLCSFIVLGLFFKYSVSGLSHVGRANLFLPHFAARETLGIPVSLPTAEASYSSVPRDGERPPYDVVKYCSHQPMEQLEKQLQSHIKKMKCKEREAEPESQNKRSNFTCSSPSVQSVSVMIRETKQCNFVLITLTRRD